MTKKKNVKRYFSPDYSYFHGIVEEIIEYNKEYPIKEGFSSTRFKNVFACSSPVKSDKWDERLTKCVSWERQLIAVGDLISMRGFFTENCFIVKGLSILSKAETKERSSIPKALKERIYQSCSGIQI
ncbi:hypothetical protein IJ531_05300 [bacterium]|nr:hypothetical protein [bacterium]